MKSLMTVLLIATMAMNPILACDCHPTPPPKEALKKSAAVFVGKVTKFEKLNDGMSVATIAVEKQWKGDLQATVRVKTETDTGMCGYGFNVGTTYVVYTYLDDNKEHTTDNCTRTTKLEGATDELKELGEPTK